MTPTEHQRHLIALAIRDRMGDVQMTQANLAGLLRISQSTIIRRLNGATSWPVEEFLAACDVLGLDAAHVISTARKPVRKVRRSA